MLKTYAEYILYFRHQHEFCEFFFFLVLCKVFYVSVEENIPHQD